MVNMEPQYQSKDQQRKSAPPWWGWVVALLLATGTAFLLVAIVNGEREDALNAEIEVEYREYRDLPLDPQIEQADQDSKQVQ